MRFEPASNFEGVRHPLDPFLDSAEAAGAVSFVAVAAPQQTQT
jgi:hypothetical protein